MAKCKSFKSRKSNNSAKKINSLYFDPFLQYLLQIKSHSATIFVTFYFPFFFREKKRKTIQFQQFRVFRRCGRFNEMSSELESYNRLQSGSLFYVLLAERNVVRRCDLSGALVLQREGRE